MLHPITEDEAKAGKYRCEVCKENAAWKDKEFWVEDARKANPDGTKQKHKIGTGKGLVYATCDHCKKVVCGHPDVRPPYAMIRVHRLSIPDIKIVHKSSQGFETTEQLTFYKGSPCCMQEMEYINHMDEVKLVQCCRHRDCIQYFEDDKRQKDRKKVKYGG